MTRSSAASAKLPRAPKPRQDAGSAPTGCPVVPGHPVAPDGLEAPRAPDRFEVLPVADLAESRTNQRLVFRALDELAASIRAHGILEPLLVRPATLSGARFELVCGARRLRAARLAGLAAVPAIVRELDDRAALEIQVIENDQREDIAPLDQARGYQALVGAGFDVPSIALRIGREESYVYRRLQLLKLIPELQEALDSESLAFAAALDLARIPPDAQQEFWKACGRWAAGERGISAVAARNWIADFAVRDLAGAPWKKDDADLLPAAGPCVTCSKRTGYNLALFADTDPRRDLCTDAKCFAAKQAAFVQLQTSRLKAEHGGRVVLVSNNYYGAPNGVLGASAYDRLSAKEAAKAKPGDVVPAVVVDGADAGHAVQVRLVSPRERRAAESAPQRAREKRAKELGRLQAAILDRIVQAIDDPLTPETMRLLFGAFVDRMAAEQRKPLLKRHADWKLQKVRRGGSSSSGEAEVIMAAFDAAPPASPALHRLVVEACLVGHTHVGAWGTLRVNEDLAKAAESFGVDVDQVKAELKALAAEKNPKKGAGKGKAGGRRTAGNAPGEKEGSADEVV